MIPLLFAGYMIYVLFFIIFIPRGPKGQQAAVEDTAFQHDEGSYNRLHAIRVEGSAL